MCLSPASLQSVTAFVNNSISVSVANSTAISMLVESSSNVLKQIQLYLEQLATALDLSVVTYDMVLNADSTPQPLPQAIEDIQESLTRLLEVLLGVHRLVVAAEQHGADISSAAEEVQRQAKDIRSMEYIPRHHHRRHHRRRRRRCIVIIIIIIIIIIITQCSCV